MSRKTSIDNMLEGFMGKMATLSKKELNVLFPEMNNEQIKKVARKILEKRYDKIFA